MPSAELNIKTTHDGTQAERSIAKLEQTIERLGSNVSGRITAAFAGLFSVEKILQFGKAIDATLSKTAELVDKIRQGKATIDDLDKTGVSREQAGFATEYQKFKDQISGPLDNLKMILARLGIAGVAMNRTVLPIVAANNDLKRVVGAAVTPQSNRVQEAFDAGNVERERQSTISYIERMSGETPLGRNQPRVSSEMLTIQRTQLQELQKISRALNPAASKLLDRNSMFPN